MAIQELKQVEINEVSGGALDLGGILQPVLNLVGGLLQTVLGLVTGLLGTVLGLVGGLLGGLG
ncbi:MAG: hypothetical protein HGA75_13680 [Thiobacillus sp.]|nr:hypothetical protein [Thiobacillus sp.]